jgi:single-stranded DNA-binding protein
MPINEGTKYRIANVWSKEDNKFIQDQFDFEDKGNVGVGKMNWSTRKKNKQGEVSFVSSSLKFICFGESKELIANNLGAKFNIEASLCNESFTNQEGKKIQFWQLTIFEASLAEDNSSERDSKKVDKHNVAKANSYVKEPEDLDLSDEIPF